MRAATIAGTSVWKNRAGNHSGLGCCKQITRWRWIAGTITIQSGASHGRRNTILAYRYRLEKAAQEETRRLAEQEKAKAEQAKISPPATPFVPPGAESPVRAPPAPPPPASVNSRRQVSTHWSNRSSRRFSITLAIFPARFRAGDEPGHGQASDRHPWRSGRKIEGQSQRRRKALLDAASYETRMRYVSVAAQFGELRLILIRNEVVNVKIAPSGSSGSLSQHVRRIKTVPASKTPSFRSGLRKRIDFIRHRDFINRRRSASDPYNPSHAERFGNQCSHAGADAMFAVVSPDASKSLALIRPS